MRTTIDGAGRLVIPKAIREAAGLRPGTELEISERDGRIQLEAASRPMRLVQRDGFLAAEIEGDDGPPLTVEEVRATLERVRR
jgi:AbrB family looped-hinge helix DNA binding protein